MFGVASTQCSARWRLAHGGLCAGQGPHACVNDKSLVKTTKTSARRPSASTHLEPVHGVPPPLLHNQLVPANLHHRVGLRRAAVAGLGLAGCRGLRLGGCAGSEGEGRAVGGSGPGPRAVPPAGGIRARLVGSRRCRRPGCTRASDSWGVAQPCMLGSTPWAHALPSPATAATWRRLLKLLRGAGRAWLNRARAEGAARCRVAVGRACTVTAAMAAMLLVALRNGRNGWPTPPHPVVCCAC